MDIKGTTMVAGVFGYPVRHSLSPVFQNAGFRALGLDWVYVPLAVDPRNLEKAVDALRVFGFAGVNVTIPHKREIIRYLDELDRESEILGSVNTVHNRDGRLLGYTTDGGGFMRSLKEEGKFRTEGTSVFVSGAGGSSYAICGALAREGIRKLYLCNRTEDRARLLKEHLDKKLGFSAVEVVGFDRRNDGSLWKTVDLYVNTTSVGMKEGDGSLIEKKNLHPGLFVYDIVYNRETEILTAARERGLHCLGGLLMLVYQGAISFEIWTGKPAPVDAMKHSLFGRSEHG